MIHARAERVPIVGNRAVLRGAIAQPVMDTAEDEIVHDILARDGRPLDVQTRAAMEMRFGRDFSRVRVHADSVAAESARALDARAYTVGANLVFGNGMFQPGSEAGQRLLAHELAHALQQGMAPRPSSKLRLAPTDDGAEREATLVGEQHLRESNQAPVRGGMCACGRPVKEPGGMCAQCARRLRDRGTNEGAGAARILEKTRIGIQRQQAQPRTQSATQPAGNAVRPQVEALLNSYAAARSNDEKGKLGVQAVWLVINAYGFSRQGLADVRFNPTLTKFDGTTHALGDRGRQSWVEFGPGAFTSGFEWLVHAVAHELEHVRQNMFADYRGGGGDEAFEYPVQEFLSYSSSVLQAGPTAGRSGRGLLSELRHPVKAPQLPPLPPDSLAKQAASALEAWKRMKETERSRYWSEFEGTRDRLLERLTNEAPVALRPPSSAHDSAEFEGWRRGSPPNMEPFSPEYQDWAEATRGPWSRVRDVWKDFDSWKRPSAVAPRPIGGVVG